MARRRGPSTRKRTDRNGWAARARPALYQALPLTIEARAGPRHPPGSPSPGRAGHGLGILSQDQLF